MAFPRVLPVAALAAGAALALYGCTAGPSASPSVSPPGPGSAVASSSASSSPATGSVPSPVSAARPCVASPPPGRYDHVLVVVMENKAAGDVLGTQSAPRLTGFAAACASATGYHAVAHPSLPNYLVLTSGSTHGVTDDAGPYAHPLPGPSVFGEVAAAGRTWATYAEGMPAPCARTSAGRYAVKHNPATYYTSLRPSCAANDVPLGSLDGGPLVTAVRSGRLPAFSFVVPDLCNDTHDCPVSVGDAWLGRFLDLVAASPVYATGRTAVLVTWDEDDGGGSNRVGLVAVAPSVRPGTVTARTFDHRSLLRTVEDLLGLSGSLVPGAVSMRTALGL